MKRYSTLLVIKEIQMRTMMKCHYIPIRTAKIKKKVIILNAGNDAEKLDLLCIAERNRKQLGSFLKN